MTPSFGRSRNSVSWEIDKIKFHYLKQNGQTVSLFYIISDSITSQLIFTLYFVFVAKITKN